MRKLFVVLALILVACSFLAACGETQVASAPSVSNTAVAAPTPEPTPAATPEPVSEEETGYDYTDAESANAALAEYYRYYIEQADKCRVKVGDNEYYFDTSKYMLMYLDVEFPLYMYNKDSKMIYLGTTGYSFQVCEPYIYVESDLLWEDYPGREMIRVVNVNDLSVTPFGRDVLIYVPDMQGDKVYYNYEIDDCIYVADPSLKNAKELHIEVPDKEMIEEKIGFSIDDDWISENIRITDASDGWIYFSYDVLEYEGGTFYEGNYRIKTDGSEIENVGEGEFSDWINY